MEKKRIGNLILIAGKRSIGNMYLEGNSAFYQAMEYNEKSYSGKGDLFASAIMGSMMRGENLENAVQLTVKFLTEVIHDSYMEDVFEFEGINFEKYLVMLA